MLTRFEQFREYARLCEENAERSREVRSILEWQAAAREWSRMALEAAKEDRRNTEPRTLGEQSRGAFNDREGSS